MKINTRWKTAEDFNMLRGAPVWTKVKHFWRKGWIEVPVIMGSSILAVIGVGMIGYTLYYLSYHDMNPKYFRTPRIYRPDDPEIQRIKRVSHFDN